MDIDMDFVDDFDASTSDADEIDEYVMGFDDSETLFEFIENACAYFAFEYGDDRNAYREVCYIRSAIARLRELIDVPDETYNHNNEGDEEGDLNND